MVLGCPAGTRANCHGTIPPMNEWRRNRFSGGVGVENAAPLNWANLKLTNPCQGWGREFAARGWSCWWRQSRAVVKFVVFPDRSGTYKHGEHVPDNSLGKGSAQNRGRQEIRTAGQAIPARHHAPPEPHRKRRLGDVHPHRWHPSVSDQDQGVDHLRSTDPWARLRRLQDVPHPDPGRSARGQEAGRHKLQARLLEGLRDLRAPLVPPAMSADGDCLELSLLIAQLLNVLLYDDHIRGHESSQPLQCRAIDSAVHRKITDVGYWTLRPYSLLPRQPAPA